METLALGSAGLEVGELPDGQVLVGDVDRDEALAAVADALWQTDMYWPPNEDPDYVAWRALVHWRTSGRRVERDWEPLPDTERRALLDDFAAAHGESLGLDPGVVEVLADTFVDFGDAYVSQGVLGWSPGEVEVFMLDWVHRKVLLDAEAMEALPDVLAAGWRSPCGVAGCRRRPSPRSWRRCRGCATSTSKRQGMPGGRPRRSWPVCWPLGWTSTTVRPWRMPCRRTTRNSWLGVW